ncbi:NUDIX domain-containing protein [Jatrophihabitans sp.]|uniref:NUDIX hydrolase n=1 Tax=Jatrophihabitans sp. TaxID=1932789 RepID=UPI0030C71635
MIKGEPCAGGIVFDEQRRLLVILRRNPPAAGRWSIPGGRCLPDETSRTACIREVAEETGLNVEPLRLAGSVQLAGPAGPYAVDDWICRLLGGRLQAGDDAAGARWVDRAELLALPTAPGLIDALSGWDVLPD